jgi:hypothetical protein
VPCLWSLQGLRDLDLVLESIQAPRFMDFSKMMCKENSEHLEWHPVASSRGDDDASTTTAAQQRDSHIMDDDDFRLPSPHHPLISCYLGISSVF